MKNSKCAVIAAIALCAFVLSAVSEEAQGQITRMYRGSVKDHAKTPPRLKKRPPLQIPDGLLEVSREHILKKIPPCDISPAKRIGIAPLPSPMPRPHQRRIGIEPNPSPSPRVSQAAHDLIIDPIYCPALLDLLIDLHAEAVMQGDLGGADLLEELIVVWPQF